MEKSYDTLGVLTEDGIVLTNGEVIKGHAFEIVKEAKMLFDNKRYGEFMKLINSNFENFGEFNSNIILGTKISESTRHILDDMTRADDILSPCDDLECPVCYSE